MADLVCKVPKEEIHEKVPFIHLHLHTEYSLLDGASRITQGNYSPLFDECLKLGMPGVAITDHGNMMGAYPAYSTLKQFKKFVPEDREFNVIYGNEFYTVEDMHRQESTRRYDYNHLVILAKSQQGLANLSALTSLSYTEGFYGKPRIDLTLLRKYSEGLVCLSACLAGVIPQYLINDDYDKALAYAKELQDIFGKEDFYIELQDHGIPEERKILPLLAKLADEIGAKVVATNDVHYIKKSDAEMHDVMLCIQTGARVSDERRMRFETQEFYLKSYEEMQKLFAWRPDALTNTIEIMDKCKGLFFKERDIERLYPTYVPPTGYTPETYLRKLTEDGLKKRYGDKLDQAKIDRANEELSVIHVKGFDSYYLVVWDFINYAKSVDIPIGPGRGSGVGSIVAYAIGITNVEPLRYSLFFERFLNPERNSPPDFDIDICTERRGEVIDYVVNKYGRDRVCQILTLGTLKPKNAIADVGRVYDVPLDLVNKTKKMLPNDPKLTLPAALGLVPPKKPDDPDPKVPEFIELYETNETMHRVIDMAMKLEGMPKNMSKHAAGVVICNVPVIEAIPVLIQRKAGKDDVVTQFQKTEVEELGLLKMDFLGLITLTDIHHAIKYVKQDHGIDVDFDKMDVDDPEVFKMIAAGDTDFVFQLENGGMRKTVMRMQTSKIEELIAAISLYRPGPMAYIDTYIKCKKDPSLIEYPHECLRDILAPTYGVFVYQEQVMQAATTMSNYTLGEADSLRRAMGKKKADVMAKERAKFVKGAVEVKGIPEDAANKTFDIMEKFATYAFNKSHAAAYAYIAYQTAYLKRYYYIELACAILNNRITKSDQLLKYINIIKDHGYQILPADVNKSHVKFKVENGAIRFGLTAIKNIGEQVAEDIVTEREANGEYKSLADFINRLDTKVANKTTIENCTKAGAMDCFGHTRATIMQNYAGIIKKVQEDKKYAGMGQMTLFDLGGMEDPASVDNMVEVKEFPKLEKLAMEKEVLNTYMTGHPLEEYKHLGANYEFNLGQILPLLATNEEEDEESEDAQVEMQDEEAQELEKEKQDLKKQYNGAHVKLMGLLDATEKKSYENKKTHEKSLMGTGKLVDSYSSIPILLFSRVFDRFKSLFQDDIVVEVEGDIKIKDDDTITLYVSNIRKLNTDDEVTGPKEQLPRRIFVMGDENMSVNENLQLIKEIIGKSTPEGKDTISFQYQGKLYLCQGVHFEITDTILLRLESRFEKCIVKELTI